jgi:uncharacterized membrane protein
MAASNSSDIGLAASAAFGDRSWQFADETRDEVTGESVLEWVLRRNCAMRPGQVLIAFGALSALSLFIASGFWLVGATLVMPFTWLELVALAIALWVYARHATDRERLRLAGRTLVVERVNGARTDRTEFDTAWLRVEPKSDERSLIELSGQGRRVAVGRFVRPDLRCPLASELRRAVHAHRER